jgi:hypothetical protein
MVRQATKRKNRFFVIKRLTSFVDVNLVEGKCAKKSDLNVGSLSQLFHASDAGLGY